MKGAAGWKTVFTRIRAEGEPVPTTWKMAPAEVLQAIAKLAGERGGFQSAGKMSFLSYTPN